MPLRFKKKPAKPTDQYNVKVAGFSNLTKVFESPRSRIFRATRDQDQRSVILKILQEEYIDRSEVLRYKNQFAIVTQTDLECTPSALELVKYHNSPMLVFEDCGLASLQDFLNQRQLSIDEALEVGLALADALIEIHSKGVIHKDINPSNLLYDPEDGILKVIDFGISTLLTREHANLDAEAVTEGSLPYMSPEQTGRMNRYLDNRTDLYSFGVVLYQLLTGALPFESDDPLQLIHYHIAKAPIPVNELDSAIPPILSDIVMKLLEKNVEDRYQSAWGVKADLQKCKEDVANGRQVKPFPIGLQDISDQLRISQNLYGRNKEIALMQTNYEAVTTGRKVAVFISGYPGIGKTSLTKELFRQVSQHRGFYISGKFEVLRRAVPYSAISDALNELCRQILSESEYLLHEWRMKIRQELGHNAQIIVDLVPELEHIIGVQKPVQTLGASENENRFIIHFKKFLRLFSSPEHPLVLYLDDLQWIDLSSMRLLKMILDDQDLHGIYFIGAFRDKEVSDSHPLTTVIEHLDSKKLHVDKIHLLPLKEDDINQLIADSLHMKPKATIELSQLVFAKTGGNPFFTEEFLKNLYENKFLYLDAQRGCWTWNVERIKQADLTDNIVELMTDKITKLPDNTVNLIKLASCIGEKFDLETLANLAEVSVSTVSKLLRVAVNQGLLIPIGENYRLLDLEISAPRSEVEIEYRFSHDRILQAASELMDPRKRMFVRRRVAKVLLSRSEQDIDDSLFIIVNHLNHSRALIQSQEEIVKFLTLNLRAAIKAKKSSAFALAYEYLCGSADLLTEELWNAEYRLCLDYCKEACETSFLAQKRDDMETFGGIVLERSKTLIDKIPVYETQVQAAIARNDMQEAVEQGKKILAMLGVKISPNPSMLQILWSFIRCWWKLLGVDYDKLIDGKKMTDPEMLARVHFQYTLSQCIFLYLPKQVPLSICDTVLMSIRHGMAPTSALAFSTYGIMIAGIFGSYEKGYKFGQLGLKMLKNLDAKEVEATILVSFNLYLRPWRDPIRSTLPSLLEAYQSGIDAGNVEFAVHAAMGYCYRSFLAGVDLQTVDREMIKYQHGIRALDHHGNIYIHQLYHQVVDNLISEKVDIEPWRIKGQYYDDDEMLVLHRQNKDAAGLFLTHFLKVYMAFLFDQNELALEWGQQAQQEFKAGIGTYNATVFYYFRALSLMRALDHETGRTAKKMVKELRKILKKFKKWTLGCRANQGHRYLLLKAEYSRLQGRSFYAQKLYDEAITTAKHNEFYQDEALGNELAARFHLEENRQTMAMAYMKRARYSYQRWGALSKVLHLEKNYPHLINSPGDRSLTGSLATMSSSTIDITTLKKALLAIAEETIHSRMLEKIISSAIEFAGAQKGVLLLKKDEDYFIEAEGSVDLDTPKILQSISLEDSEEICIPVINYVKRTGKAIVIDDATNHDELIPNLNRDPYIVGHKIKSILCIPILLGGSSGSEIIGLLYLENNRTTNAFSVERIETLEIICLSAAGRLELSVKAATDGLTGLYNHDYFQSMLEQEILQSQRQLRNLSLVMIDIDHFKGFNDKWGHQVGDLVLKHVSDLIKQTCRKSDIVARYGGEELSVILPETNSELAEVVAERIRVGVEQSIVEYEGHHLSVTVSIGVAYLREDIRTANSLIKHADEALYKSKEQGRNLVTIS